MVYLVHFQASIVDNFGILAYVQALIADNFGISEQIQALIRDDFGIFNTIGKYKHHSGLRALTPDLRNHFSPLYQLRHQFSKNSVYKKTQHAIQET